MLPMIEKKLGFTLFFLIYFFYSIQVKPFDNSITTNFDWEYYTQNNNLNFNNEIEALEHYRKDGFYKDFHYCKKFNIVILLTVNNINLVNNFIDQINHFMRINELNNYYIKINIPSNIVINHYEGISYSPKKDKEEIFKKMSNLALYNHTSITKDNCENLYSIYKYFKKNLDITKNQLQIIFTESFDSANGFLLLMEQLIQQNILHDFIINLNSEFEQESLENAMSFLNIRVNKLLSKINCLYSHQQQFIFDKDKNDMKRNNMHFFLDYFNISIKNFDYPKNGMFLASNKITEFFKSHNITEFKNLLEKNNLKDHFKENFNKLLGLIIYNLNLTTQIIDFNKRDYIDDNKCSSKKYALNHNPNDIRKYIDNYNIKLMAIYFPQFHEFEENNTFWGKGFTEWTLLNNYKDEIKKPHVDIGQYNMLDYDVRKKQAGIAKKYGINAFCYYHYWFKDKKVMHQGIEKILEDGEPDIPFVLCWANEPWTRTWSPWITKEGEVLLKQEYGNEEDWIKHYNYLLQFFKHPNYIKENNCPILYIYRINHIYKQNALEMLKLWKKMIKNDGFDDLKIIAILGGICKNVENIYSQYCDGYAEHQPTFASKTNPLIVNEHQTKSDIEKFTAGIIQNKKIHQNYTRGIFYSFDNSCRKPNSPSLKFINLSYNIFENYLVQQILNIIQEPNDDNNFILLNSWNEWSEQAMVEPNDHDGYKILEVIQKYFG